MHFFVPFFQYKRTFQIKNKGKEGFSIQHPGMFPNTEQFPYNESKQSEVTPEVNSAILCTSTQCDHINHIEIHCCIQYCRN